MFWLHGGSFINGSGNSDVYGPEFLITHDIVLVTINYRLGILGRIFKVFAISKYNFHTLKAS